MNIAIVTNSFHRELSLVERSLEHSLKHAAEVSQVIFIDQNDEKLNLKEEIKNHPKLNHLHIKVKCVSEARNSFEIPTDCDWLIFCDDDGYIAEDYMTNFKSYLSQNPHLEIIAGSIIRDDNFKAYSPRHDIGGDLQNFRHTKLLMGSNFAVKAKTFKNLGGFDEMFGAGSYWGSGEETDFCWHAYFEKVPMQFNYDMKVYHVKPYAGDFEHSKKKAFQYGIGKGALVSKWLLQKKKLVVTYELAEMIFIPLAQSLVNALKFNFKQSIINFYTIAGRIKGLLKYTFQK